jgi:hypothetical protein
MGWAWLTGMAIGAVSEAGAYWQQLWVYRKPIYPVLNILGMFGLVMGSLAELAPSLGLSGVFAVGFGVGLVYEILNLFYLDWWYFPGDRLGPLRGRRASALGVSVAWGAVPVVTALICRIM